LKTKHVEKFRVFAGDLLQRKKNGAKKRKMAQEYQNRGPISKSQSEAFCEAEGKSN
jgi:hypothetical protein